MKENSRRCAAFAVARWLATRDIPSGAFPEGPDRAFVQDLVYTVLRRLRALRKVLGVLVPRWPKGELEVLLYVGAAQILYMPDVPDFAAVSETVEAAKASGNASVAKVVNGVLRNLIRRRAEFKAMLADASPEERESFPTAIYRRWVERFGAEKAEALCRWHNEPAVTYLATRPVRALDAEMFPPPQFQPLGRGRRVDEVEGYSEGLFIVQDPGTALAVKLVDARPGDRILDVCAAPGGKTVQLAWRGAAVVACEVNPRRRRRLEENLARLRLTDGVTVASGLDDSAVLTPGGFAKVLVDAPCSNTGVLRRRPDARWNWSEERLASLVRLQAEILDAAARLVAPGGALVYSTCSNEPEENAGQVAAFLARHPDFALEADEESVPVDSGYDGAFAARLRRESSVHSDNDVMTLDGLLEELRGGARVILQVRHAERPRIDQNDPTFGDGVALTGEGVRTARALGERLRAFVPDVQFAASPLKRTRMTAALIAEGMGLANAEIPVDDLLGNGSFYYANPAEVLEVFKNDHFFDACFEYFRTGEQRGFRNLRVGADANEDWLLARFRKRLFVVVTHDCYIAAFLAAKRAVGTFTRENWPRFLDGGAILLYPDGRRRYALVRTGLSQGIRGVV